MPNVRMHGGCDDVHEQLVRSGYRLPDVAQLQHIGRSVPILDDGSHRAQLSGPAACIVRRRVTRPFPMDDELTAAIEQRTELLLQDALRSFEIARHQFDRSQKDARARVEELFAAYDEFLRLVFSKAAVSAAVSPPPAEVVVTIERHDVGPELVFAVQPRQGATG